VVSDNDFDDNPQIVNLQALTLLIYCILLNINTLVKRGRKNYCLLLQYTNVTLFEFAV